MKDIIINYILEQLLVGRGEVQLAAEDDLLGSGLIDSMGMMSLIAFVENQFELKVPPQDMTIENFMNVEAIANYLDRRTENK
ncbi:MAG: acyl carrier protein [Cyclobacteriaceae bacterium]